LFVHFFLLRALCAFFHHHICLASVFTLPLTTISVVGDSLMTRLFFN
jgi:hypothetical protein